MSGDRWNSSLHALEVMLREVPPGAENGLDVGCGEGETARRLRRRIPHVVGLDTDAASIDEARSHGDDIEYLVGDVMTSQLGEAAFDVVAAVGMLHHVDHRAGLARLSRHVRPGGVLLVVGLAASRSAVDLARDAFDTVAVRRHTLAKRVWETPAPKVWPPPLSYGAVRELSLATLPGVRFRRLPYFRYGFTWTPSGPAR